MKKLLWIGDAGVATGFAKATHEILGRLCQDFDVSILGINYRGDSDPRLEHFRMFSCAPGSLRGADAFGLMRLIEVCDRVQPDLIVLQNDGWNIINYMEQLVRFPEHALIPVVAIVALDGKNFQGGWLEGVAHAVFWTDFGLAEARAGGYAGPASVIPLGVDLNLFSPRDKREARLRRFGEKLVDKLPDMFVVGNVNRNQPRKRWDLTIRYFADWIKTWDVSNAFLYLHVAPTGDMGVDVRQLMQYYGVYDRLLLFEPPMWSGIPEEDMADVYSSFDVQITTTQGEGFGLTTMEGMACGVPQIVPDWSALGDVCKHAACLISCPTTEIGPPYVNVLGGIADQAEFVNTLQALYAHREHRAIYRRLGLDLADEPRFRWNNIAEQYAALFESILFPASAYAVKELA
jgi:D-inositol-3-phosphate glycosyltransferase